MIASQSTYSRRSYAALSPRVAITAQACLLLWTVSPSSGQPSEIVPLSIVPVPAAIVHARGAIAAVANGDTLTVLDLSNPRAPVRRGSVTLSDRIWDLVIDGKFAYVANGFVGLVVVDLTDPVEPTVRGTYTVVSQGQTVSVSMAGELVLTTNNQTGLNVFDVSNPTEPRLLSSWLTGGYSRDVIGLGTLGLVADQPDGLYVIDLSDPLDPVESSIHFAEGETTQIVAATGSNAYIVDASSRVIEIVNLAEPQEPVLTGRYLATSRVANLAAEGDNLYLALGKAGLVIVNTSNPAAPKISAVYDTPGTAQVVSVDNDLVLVADGEALVVLRRQR